MSLMQWIVKLRRPAALGLVLASLALTMAIYLRPSSAQATTGSYPILKPFNLVTDEQPNHVFGNTGASAAPYRSLATITVNSLEDTAIAGDAKCTLREAIANANADAQTTGGDCAAGSGADMITFTVTGTIGLMSALPTITASLTISGPGPALLDVRQAGGNG